MIKVKDKDIALFLKQGMSLEDIKFHFEAALKFCGFEFDDIEFFNHPTKEDLELKVVYEDDE